MGITFIGLDKENVCGGISVETEGDISISAAVGIGGKNVPADVKTIQEALNAVPPDKGGPRQLLAVDGRAGKLTIEAISRFQKRNVGFSDGRVDTNNVTIAALRTFNGGTNGDIPKRPTTPTGDAKKKNILKAPKKPKPLDAADIDAMQLVSKLLKEARRWVFLGDTVAARAQDHLQGTRGGSFRNSAAKSFNDCDKFFKLKGIPKSNALAALTFIRGIFFKMKTCIEAQIRLDVDPKSPLGFFQVDPTDNNTIPPLEALMFTEFGGFDSRDKNGKPRVSPSDGFRDDSIFVATKTIFAQKLLLTDSKITADETTYLMIHELAHFVGPPRKSPNRLDDFAARHVSKSKFDNLGHFQALRNADSYGRFCAHVTPGVKFSPKMSGD